MPHGARVTWPHIAHLQHQQNSQIPATQDQLQTPSPLRQYQQTPVPRKTWQCHHKHLHTTTDEIHCNEMLSCPTINSRTQSNQTLNFVQWGQPPHCTTLGVKQTANMIPFLSVCQSWQQTRSHSDLQRKCHQRSSLCRDPNLDATKAHKWHPLLWQEEVDPYHGCLAGLLKKMCLKSVLLGLPDPNKANATGSLSTHFGFTRLTKSCVTNERSEPVSNITVASVTPWLPCTVTRANCNATDGCDADMSPGGVEFATLMKDVVDDECVADVFTLPLDCGGGDDTLLTPAEVGPTAGGPHMISWWQPLHFRHTTLHPFAICPGNKHRKHKPADFNFSFFTWMDPLNLKHFSVGWFFHKNSRSYWASRWK